MTVAFFSTLCNCVYIYFQCNEWAGIKRHKSGVIPNMGVTFFSCEQAQAHRGLAAQEPAG